MPENSGAEGFFEEIWNEIAAFFGGIAQIAPPRTSVATPGGKVGVMASREVAGYVG